MFRFAECFEENVQVHGLAWTIKYYSKRMQEWELMFWVRNYCRTC